ncbi:MAG: hypothetical protein JXR16_11250 [Bermanella sp.]
MSINSSWEKRAEALGLAEHQCNGHPIQKVYFDLADMKNWSKNCVVTSSSKKSALTVDDVKGLSEPKVRIAIEKHILGTEELDKNVESAMSQKMNSFVIYAAAAKDIKVTANDPLIINKPGILTTYGTVTIENGGYIEISTTCSFQCDTLIKKASNLAANAEADIVIHGVDGNDGKPGAEGHAGANGKNGSGKECDCCGGEVAHSASPGGPGSNGGPGGNGAAGGNAGLPITVKMDLGDITGSVTLLARGANGGKGGDGGTGGKGGNGGKGGDGGSCGAYHPSGKNGGNAGDGGNGGNNASGGNASNGGDTHIVYNDKTSSGTLTPQNSIGSGGAKGSAGQPGAAGTPGSGGSHGGVSGSGGSQGDSGQDVSTNGSDAQKGTLTINGTSVN